MLRFYPDSKDLPRYSIENIKEKIFTFKTEADFNKEFDFEKSEILGRGAFGEVRKCKSKSDDHFYAIKRMQDRLGKIDFKEVEITKKIAHSDNVLKYFGYYYW